MIEARAGYRQIDHTADLALEIWAATEAEMLATGARAVIAILTESAEISPSESRVVNVEALDPEDRLVQWLNEIIVTAIVDGFLFAEIETLELYPGSERKGQNDADGPGSDGDSVSLRARIRGQADGSEHIATELKSATYHDLQLTITEARAECRVVIDV